MAKAELKTKKTKLSVEKFLESIKDETQRADSVAIVEMMKKITKEEPKMWGSSMVGFGDYHYVSERTGREGDWFMTGFSPRKGNLSLHLMSNMEENADLLKKLGKHTTGVGCLYIKKLDDVDTKVLKDVIKRSVEEIKKKKKK
jgi:hypothetical protein